MSHDSANPLRERTFQEDEPVCVSICSITFNHADFIAECLDSFLDQTCDFRVEVIVHDDASTDGTADIIREYADRHPSIIRPILQQENQYSKGINPYYVYVLPKARGEFVAICDGDDFWRDPAKLTKQVAVLRARKDIALTYGPANSVDETGAFVSKLKKRTDRDLSPEELKSVRGLNTLTTCFRNILRDKPAPAFLRNSPIGDLTLWAMLGYHGGGAFLNDLEPACYRVHSGGILSRQDASRQNYMSALAHLSIAAFHRENGDRDAERRSGRNVLKFMAGTDALSAADLSATAIKSAASRLKN